MSTDVLVARALLALPVILVLFVTGACMTIVVTTIREWNRNADKTVPGGMWQGILFATVIDTILLAGMDVGQFFVLWTDGWQGIVAVIATLFMPWLGYRAATTKFTGKKADGEVTISSGEPKP